MSEAAAKTTGEKRWRWLEWPAALLLFAASAAVVVWQNSRLGVLWDASYILENSYRISLGDVPYRDFPFPYAPLTFLTQAAVIKLTGRVFWHHIVYSAAVGGLSSVLAWRVILNCLRGGLKHARLVAYLLSAPLVVLGIYAIFPHPFYDPDCTFAILVCVLLWQRAERKGFPTARALISGAALALPVFVKQNTGLAFLLSTVAALAALIAVEALRGRAVRGYVRLLAGAFVGLAAALVIIQLTAGLDNYVRWTVRFAAARRTPPLADMLQMYQNRLLPCWLAATGVGAVLLRLNRDRDRRALALASAGLMSLPFVWAVVYLFVDPDTSEQAERLVDVWPFVLVVSFVLAVLSLRRRAGLALVLPFVLIATAHGAFLSQQLWGSTYGLWPLLLILVAYALATPFEPSSRNEPSSNDEASSKGRAARASAWFVVTLAALVAASLLAAGGHYVWTHERLDYANLSEGELARPTLPALKGLSVRGSWVPDFEELVAYTEREIPRDQGILMLPGEDLFYYATGRRPRFPVLMFDRTVNPYSPEEVVELARQRDIRWLVVKEELQLDEEQVEEDRDRMLELLKQDFKQVESLNNYRIYRRRTGAEDPDEDEDEGDDSEDDSDN
ncbi:MAG: hypothetical protein M3348_12895 [Acidobacteriota bacterium]|nr:hypothetical protein [Acidobacteriota bacterium]